MQQMEKSEAILEKKRFTPSDTWEKIGITEHQGGIPATQRLIELCKVTPDQSVLDIGCGTGYTPCVLAKVYRVAVSALDVNSKILGQTKSRVKEQGVSDKVTIVRGDACELPFPSDAFSVVVVESVLVHVWDRRRVFSEVYRVLKPGGVFGDNELTCLKPPPTGLRNFLTESMGIVTQPLQEDEWRALFREAGFVDVSSSVYAMNELVSFTSHIQVDGFRRYLSALRQSLLNPTIRDTFFRKDMLKAALKFSSYVGYGLYVGRKA